MTRKVGIGIGMLIALVSTLFVSSSPVRGETVTLPNLRLHPVIWGVGVGSPNPFFPYSGPGALRFGVLVENVGAHPLELVAMPQAPTDPAKPTNTHAQVVQCVDWVGPACVQLAEGAGEIVWRADQSSTWYLPGFLHYELRRLNADGDPEWSPEGIVSVHRRERVCVHDAGPAPGSSDPEPVAIYRQCTSLRMGLSAGWSYLIHPHVFDQYVPIDNVADGRYALVVVVDADGLLLETDKSDNATHVIVEISDDGRIARLVS